MNLILLILYFGFINCLEVIPERCKVERFNTKYIKYVKCDVRRYGRRSPYYGSVSGYNYHTWDNNLTMDVIFYEHLSNEYRRSFIELHFKGCNDLMKNGLYISQMMRNVGIKCPFPPGEHEFANVTVPTENFPNVFPFQRGRVDTTLSIADTQEEILYISFCVTFKQTIKKKI